MNSPFIFRLLTLALSLVLVSCTSNTAERIARKFSGGELASLDSNLDYASPFGRVLAAGLIYVNRAYVYDKGLGDVALAGLANLNSADPSLSVNYIQGQGVVVSHAGRSFAYGEVASNDTRGWVTLTERVLGDTRQRSQGVAQLDQESLLSLVYRGYEKALDGYSRYLPPLSAEDESELFLGFGGIGILIDNEDLGLRVHKVLPNSPALRAGIQEGDLIIGTDGGFFQRGEKKRDRTERLKGPVNSRVNLIIARHPNKVLRINVVRDTVISEPLDWELEDAVLIVHLYTFNSDSAMATFRALSKAAEQSRKNGQRLRGVILDMRDNGGGLRQAAIDVADVFLQDKLVTQTRGRLSTVNRRYRTELPDLSRGIPLLVLINENSASASELLAAALQDAGRAVVIGSTSFGKGSVQSKLPLPNGGIFSLTTSLFYSPSGRRLNDFGVVPDLCTSNNLYKPQEFLNIIREGRYAPPSSYADQAFRQARQNLDASQFRRHCPPSEARPERDVALAKALLINKPYLNYLLSLKR